jgi:hypothetical protein
MQNRVGFLHLIPRSNVYQWLMAHGNFNSRENDNRFSAFLTALFEEVFNVIKDSKLNYQMPTKMQLCSL